MKNNALSEKSRGKGSPVFWCAVLAVSLCFLYMMAAGRTAQTLYAQTRHTLGERRRVLFISSYSYAWETVPQQITGIQNALGSGVTIDYQFMDTKNLYSEESMRLFHESMVQYLSEVPAYDALIVGDDAAFNYAVQYKDTLFAGIPIIFEGVNNVEAAHQAEADERITGVIERLSYVNTIRLAQKLCPEAVQIVGVLDDTVTGQGERVEFYQYAAQFPELAFKEINASALTQAELKNAISSLGKESILIYIMCSEDADGNQYVDMQGIDLVSSSAHIPAFSIVSIGMGRGVIGGEIVSQEGMGYIAGDMVRRIFEGTSPAEIAIQENSPMTYCFDEFVMKQYGIGVSQLPDEAVIINHIETFWERNRMMIRIFLLVTAVLCMIVAILVTDNLRKKKINRELKKTKRELQELATRDPLTALFNRRVFKHHLEEKIRNEEAFALVLFDIDHFKQINDRLGHNSGDLILKEMSRRAKQLCNGIFEVYRLAGDEFTAIISSGDEAEIEWYIKLLMGIFADCFSIEQEEIRVGSSVGVALFPKDADNARNILTAADKAMYEVKNHGRNSYTYYKGERISSARTENGWLRQNNDIV